MDLSDRLAAVEGGNLRPDSLVGSYFHGSVDHQWQGCVVAEPVSGIYLVELFAWEFGNSTSQRLVRIEDMAEWTFYDTSGWMCNAGDRVRNRWQNEIAEAIYTVG